MKKNIRIEAVPHEKAFLVDGEKIDRLILREGDVYLVEVDSVSTSASSGGVWVREYPGTPGAVVVANGTRSLRVPDSAAYRGKVPGARQWMEGDARGFPLTDVSKSTVSEMTGRSAERAAAQIDHSTFEVVVAGARLEKEVDYETFPDSTEASIRFSVEKKPSKGTLVRLETRAAGFVVGQGTRSGTMIIDVQKGHAAGREYLIGTEDGSIVLPATVVARDEDSLESKVSNGLPSTGMDGLRDFLETYFEREGDFGQPREFLRHLDRYRDIDTTTDALVEGHARERGLGVPDSALVDRRLILKRIVDFYRAKGTDRSFAFFMRIMFGKECEVHHPGDLMLRASESRWTVDRVLRVVSPAEAQRRGIGDPVGFFSKRGMAQAGSLGDTENTLLLEGARLSGLDTRSAASVERSRSVVIDGTPLVEFDVSSVIGDFEEHEILSPGSGFDPGVAEDPAHRTLHSFHSYVLSTATSLIPETPAPLGTDAYVRAVGGVRGFVAVVDRSTGNPLILDGGVDCVEGDTYEIVDYSGTVVGGGFIVPGTVFERSGRWVTPESLLSGHAELQDGWFRQMYSYVVESEVQGIRYEEVFKRVLHPAGRKMFQRVLEGSVVVGANPTNEVTTGVVRPDHGRRYLTDSVTDGSDLMVFSGSRPHPHGTYDTVSETSGQCEREILAEWGDLTDEPGWTRKTFSRSVADAVVVSDSGVSDVGSDGFDHDGPGRFVVARSGSWDTDAGRIEAGTTTLTGRVNFSTGFPSVPTLDLGVHTNQSTVRPVVFATEVDRMGFTLNTTADEDEVFSWVASESPFEDRGVAHRTTGECGAIHSTVRWTPEKETVRLTTIRVGGGIDFSTTPEVIIESNSTPCPVSAHGRSPYVNDDYEGTTDELGHERLREREHDWLIRTPSLTHEVGRDECVDDHPEWSSDSFYRAESMESMSDQGVPYAVARSLTNQMNEHARRWRGSTLRVLRFSDTPDSRRTTDFGFVLRPQLWPFDFAAGIVARCVTGGEIWCMISFLTKDIADDWRMADCLIRTHYWYQNFHDDAENWYHRGAWHDWEWPRKFSARYPENMMPVAYEVDGVGNVHKGTLGVDPRVGVVGYESPTHPTTGQRIRPRTHLDSDPRPNEHWIVGVSNTHQGRVSVPPSPLGGVAEMELRGVPGAAQIVLQRAEISETSRVAMELDSSS